MDSVRLDIANIGLASIHYHPLPVIVEEKKSRITFFIILHPKFDEGLILDRDFAYQVLNDSVLVPLRKNFESNFPEISVRRQARDLPSHLFAQEQQRRAAMALRFPLQLFVHHLYPRLDQQLTPIPSRLPIAPPLAQQLHLN